MPKVSVIIPVYNVEQYLRECLESVVNQTLKDIEIILVDDGSTDSSLEICKEYAKKDNRIKIIEQGNQGAGAARNRGLAEAKGDYVYFLDGDDYIDPKTLEKLYIKITDSYSDICFCRNNIYDENKKSLENIEWSTNNTIIPTIVPFSGNDIQDNLLQICVPNLFLKLYKRNFINKNNLKFQELKTCNDVFFNYASLILATKITYINEILVTYRKNQKNCLSANRGKTALNIITAYYALKEFLQSKNLFEKYETTIYKKAASNFRYELKFCTPQKRQELLNEIKNFLPQKYHYLCVSEITYKNMFEKIFSIKNSYDSVHKILTLCGIKIKIKRPLTKKEKEELSRLLLDNNKNKILLIEPNNFHEEVLPGIAKYFLDLGFYVDVITAKAQNNLDAFGRMQDPKLNRISLHQFHIKNLFKKNLLNNYKYIYFNTEWINTKLNTTSVSNYFNLKNADTDKYLFMNHRPNTFKNISNKNLILAELPLKNKEDFKVVNAHYFGNINITPKNKKTNFIVIGNIENKRKNHNLLIDAVTQLVKQGLTDFEITVIAKVGNMVNIPTEIKPFIEFKGRLDYPQMYEEMEKADFFLTLLDPENPEHDRYITTGTSGSFQLIYGFTKPCLISKKFADIHGFNTTNSIVYNKNSDLSASMADAINMNTQEYQTMQNNLKTYSANLYKKSLQNLGSILKIWEK